MIKIIALCAVLVLFVSGAPIKRSSKYACSDDIDKTKYPDLHYMATISCVRAKSFLFVVKDSCCKKLIRAHKSGLVKAMKEERQVCDFHFKTLYQNSHKLTCGDAKSSRVKVTQTVIKSLWV